jgi:hypothetical protein
MDRYVVKDWRDIVHVFEGHCVRWRVDHGPDQHPVLNVWVEDRAGNCLREAVFYNWDSIIEEGE